jgi:exosortase/archaeosortase family protein
VIQSRARPRNCRMVDGLKDASGRAGALNAGGAIAAPIFSNIGQAFRRGEFFAGLFILGFSNGIFERIMQAIAQGTIESAILDTYGISVLVWVACFIAVSLLLRQPPEPVTRNDLILGLAVIAAVLVPSAKVSWIALTGLGLYGLRCFEAGALARRAAFVILAVTVPMFWSRLVFAMLSDLILQADAILVTLIVRTERVGNTIGFADNSGYLYILPPCSSLANVSLAVLGWALFTQAFGRQPSLKDVWWCLAACSAVIVINVTRIALMGLHPEHFELFHGAIGAGVASFLDLAAIVGINLIRVRGDHFARS